jgi:hypothetical protein
MRPIGVTGPTGTKENGFRLKIKLEGGTDSTQRYDTKQGALGAKTRLLDKIEADKARKNAANLSEIPEFDGTLAWYVNVLGKMTRDVACGGDGEDRNNLKAVAAAATAAKQLRDMSEYEDRIADLESKTAEIDDLEKYGAGT